MGLALSEASGGAELATWITYPTAPRPPTATTMPSTMKARNALLRGPPRPRRRRRLRWEWVIAESLSVGASKASTSAREPLAGDLLARARQTIRLQAPHALQAQRRLARRALGRRARLTADRQTGAPGK